MEQPLGIVFAGGGTGGHLFPGLAVAEQLQMARPDVRITFAGTGATFERRHVRAAGHPYLALPCQPLPRRPWGAVRFAARNFLGYRAARRFLDGRRISVVVGLGGWASVPMARAAVAAGVPLVLLEQNALPGRANRWLAPRAARVCAAFEEARPHLGVGDAFCLTGNPIRQGFASTAARVVRCGPEPEKLLLVCGGSRGAASFDRHVPRALAEAKPGLRWRIIHQLGEKDAEATRAAYRGWGIRATVVPFIDDMPAALAGAQLAVCRAGGSTLAELAAAGVPAILVPYPFAADDHQRKNAEVFAAAGACSLATLDRLSAALSDLLVNEELRQSMSAAIRRLARPAAARDVAALLVDLIRGQDAT